MCHTYEERPMSSFQDRPGSGGLRTMLTRRAAVAWACAAAGVVVMSMSGVLSAPAYGGELFQKPHVLFMQQDRVVTFNITPPNPPSQPLGGGIGSQVGTATGA